MQSYLQAFLLLPIHMMTYEKKAVRIYGDGKHNWGLNESDHLIVAAYLHVTLKLRLHFTSP